MSAPVATVVERPNRNRYPRLADAVWLREQYVTLKRGPAEIRNDVGCSLPAVYQALARAGIRVRSAGGRVREHNFTAAELFDALHDNRNVTDAAASLGISGVLLRLRASECGIQVRSTVGGGVPRDPRGPDAATLTALIGEHHSWNAVADHLGVSATTALRWARARGIDTDEHLRRRDAQIIALRETRLTITAIAEQVGIEQSTVYKILHRRLPPGDPMLDRRWANRPRCINNCGRPQTTNRTSDGLCADCRWRAANPTRDGWNTIGFELANAHRTAQVAPRTVAAAREALKHDPKPVHIAVLQARIDHPTASLAELAAIIGASKDSYAGMLRRALTGATR